MDNWEIGWSILHKTLFPFKAYALPDATAGLTFKNCTFCPHCIYVFCIYLKTKSEFCSTKQELIGFYNRD